jgi:hypothetical protein
MDRRTFVKAVSGLVGTSALAGSGAGSNTSTLATPVSDQPGDIADFDRLLVAISGVRVKPAAEEELQEIDADTKVDLTELPGEASPLVNETDVDAGTCEFPQLVAEATDAVLSDGESATVHAPGDVPLKFIRSSRFGAERRRRSPPTSRQASKAGPVGISSSRWPTRSKSSTRPRPGVGALYR